jgi:hypothetical protein
MKVDPQLKYRLVVWFPAGLKPAVSLDTAEYNSAGRTHLEVYVPARVHNSALVQRFLCHAVKRRTLSASPSQTNRIVCLNLVLEFVQDCKLVNANQVTSHDSNA